MSLSLYIIYTYTYIYYIYRLKHNRIIFHKNTLQAKLTNGRPDNHYKLLNSNNFPHVGNVCSIHVNNSYSFSSLIPLPTDNTCRKMRRKQPTFFSTFFNSHLKKNLVRKAQEKTNTSPVFSEEARKFCSFTSTCNSCQHVDLVLVKVPPRIARVLPVVLAPGMEKSERRLVRRRIICAANIFPRLGASFIKRTFVSINFLAINKTPFRIF